MKLMASGQYHVVETCSKLIRDLLQPAGVVFIITGSESVVRYSQCGEPNNGLLRILISILNKPVLGSPHFLLYKNKSSNS